MPLRESGTNFPSQILLIIQVEGEPAERMLQYLSFQKRSFEEIKPKRSEEGATVSEETPGDVESVEQSSVLPGICDDDLDPDEPSSSTSLLPNSTPTSNQNVTDGVDGSQHSLLGEEGQLKQSSIDSPPFPQSATASEELRSLSIVEAEPADPSSSTSTAREGEELPPVQPLSNTSLPTNQSASDTALDVLEESKDLPPVDPLSISTSHSDQSDGSTVLDVLEEGDQLHLTLPQREAIGRRHPFKFITGHYGSGKVMFLLLRILM